MTTSGRRRTFVAFLALFALLLGACGGDDDDAADADPEEQFDPDAVLRVALNLSNDAGMRFEPIAMLTGQAENSYPVLSGWLKRDSGGEFKPDLAEEVEVVNPTTIVVEMQAGLVFSNGEKLDAAAAKATIERNMAAGNSAGLRVAELGLIQSVTVGGPTTFTIVLKSPSVALFYPLLADAELAPVAPASIAANDKTSKTVIGAGPFKIDSYDVGVQASLSRNDSYYAADEVTLGGIKFIHTESPTAIETALRSNTVDFGAISQTQAEQMTSPLEVVYDRQAAPRWLNMCIRPGAPLDNLKVRQAFNHAVDREAVNNLIHGGKTEPAWALAPSDTILGNEDLDEFYPYDVAKAKKLLAEANQSNLKLTMVYTQADERLSLLLQDQLSKAGITVDLRITQNISEDFYLNPKGELNVVPMIREGVSRLTRLVTTNAFANVCDHARPEIDAITKQLVELDPTDSKAGELWDEANEVFVEQAYGVPLVYNLTTYVYNSDTVVDLPTHTGAIMSQRIDYAYVKMKG